MFSTKKRIYLNQTFTGKLLISLCLLIFVPKSVYAANEFIPFTTIEQAQRYCPVVNALTFTLVNPSIPNSVGVITGYNHNIFESIPTKSAIHPKNMDASGLIQDVQFRSAEGMYGYSSNNVVTCLYTYTSFTGAQYALVMRGK